MEKKPSLGLCGVGVNVISFFANTMLTKPPEGHSVAVIKLRTADPLPLGRLQQSPNVAPAGMNNSWQGGEES